MKAWSDNFNALSKDIDAEEHGEYWLKGGKSAEQSEAEPASASPERRKGARGKTRAKPSASMEVSE